MPAPAEHAPFSLAEGFEDLAKKDNIDLAAMEEPKGPPEGAEGAAGAEPAKTEGATEEPAKVEDDQTDETGKQEEVPLGDAIKEEEVAEEKVEEKVEEKKPEEKKAEAAAPERDADLKHEISPHTAPKTRKIISEFQAKAKAARDGWDKEKAERAAEAAELRAKLKEAEEKVASTKLPKPVEEELTTLRERVRELDISKDPQLEAKYDRKIASNQKTIIDTLKSQGYGSRVGEDGKLIENPKAIQDLIKSGLTFGTLHATLKKLDENGLVEEAETIREALRENGRLARDKEAEIQQWKGDYETRQRQRQEQATQVVTKRNESFKTETQKVLKANLDALQKDFPYLAKPPAPLASDTPAVQKQKQQALDDYTAAERAIQDGMKQFETEGVAPEKIHEVVGRLNASAIVGVMMQKVIAPRMREQLKAANDRIAALEAQIGKVRGAQSISRQHATQATDTKGSEPTIPKDASIGDALFIAAKAAGINTNS